MKAIKILILSLIVITANINAQLKQQITQVAGKSVKTAVWQGKEVQFVEREVAVKVNISATQAEVNILLNKTNGKIVNSFDKLGWAVVELPDGKDEISTIKDIINLNFVVAAEPNIVTRVSLEPNDPYFKGTSPATYSYQWALKNTGQTPPSGTSDADIDAPEAWDITTGSSNVILAILDTGIPMVSGSLSHPDLNDPNKIILGPDYINDGNGVKDEYGHGTHVAGIAAAESNNGTGIAGIAWNCKLMPIQVFGANGGGTFAAFKSGVIYAVDYQRNNPGKKVVINYSGGGSASQEALDAVIYANTYGVPIIASAGNDCGSSVDYPAAYSSSYSNVIAVSATDQNDTFSEYSNKGSQIIVSAPGGYGTTNYCQPPYYVYFDSDDIYSTTPNYSFNIQISHPEVSQSYGYLAGTSMAAPQVAGTAALLLSLNLNYTPSQIRTILELSADDKGSSGRDDYYGYGRINANKAVRTLYVPQVYTTVESALNASVSGQTVIVSSGNYTISNSLSIQSGRTLSVSSGAVLTFSSSKKLSVYGGGTLNANGATFKGNGTAGNWNSISFYANSSGSIQNCTIKDAQCGIYATTNANVTVSNNTITNNSVYGLSILSNSNAVISDNTISNNGTGINVSTSDITISGNTIEDNTNYGINASNIGTDFYWYDNTLEGNGYAMFLNNASPYIHDNLITNNYHGILISSSDPNFADPSNDWLGYNAVTCNTATPNFKAENYSSVYAGYGYDGGYNSIFGSELPDMEAANHSDIYACNNYWGPYSPAISADGTSSILTWYPLSSDPNPGSSCSIPKSSPAIAKSANELSSDISEKYWQAISDRQEGNISSAKNLLKSLIEGSYDNKYSPLALLAFYDLQLKLSSKDNSLKQAFAATVNNLYNSSENQLRPFAARLLARDAALSNDTTNMLLYNKEIVKNYSNTENELPALFDLAIYYAETGNNLAKSKEYFSRMEDAYFEEDLTKMAEIILGNKIDVKDFNKKELASNSEINKFKLNNAYPNPFNPSTTISYQIPKDGFVTLKIFDILGKEITTLVNKFQTKGKYDINFNASNLASGIYFYQLIINNGLMSSNDFSSIKKLILLR